MSSGALEVLVTAQHSQEWASLIQKLRALAGGGPAIASLLDRCRAIGARGDVRSLENDRNTGEPAGHTASRASRAADLCYAVSAALWEKLHSGHWSSVPVAWRDGYAAACVLSASLELQGVCGKLGPGASLSPSDSGGADSAPRKEERALRQLDMAALMGGPLLRPWVDAAASALAERVGADVSSRKRGRGAAQGGGDRLRRLSPVPLPPGSLMAPAQPIPVYPSPPSLETFWREAMQPGAPVIVQGIAVIRGVGGSRCWRQRCRGARGVVFVLLHLDDVANACTIRVPTSPHPSRQHRTAGGLAGAAHVAGQRLPSSPVRGADGTCGDGATLPGRGLGHAHADAGRLYGGAGPAGG